MSTTIPLTLIEGAMALPRLRPLELLPAPFGSQWALRPAHASLRAELKALYAAVLRTFCLNAAAIRSMCRWEPRRAAAAGALGPAGQTETALAEATVTNAVGARLPQHGSTHRWSMLAGSACALGGAAVLAWIALDHVAQHRAATQAVQRGPVAKQIALVPDLQETPTHTPQPYRDEPARSTSDVAKAAGITPKEAALAPGSYGASDSDAHFDTSRAQRISSTSMETVKRPTRTVSHGASPTHTTATAAPRKWARPSAAGPFSPLMPNALGVDNYASIRMSAGTHAREPAQMDTHALEMEMSQVRSSHRGVDTLNTQNTDSTAWTQQISQRRITEVPDQFLK
jgi:hypothetical protein